MKYVFLINSFSNSNVDDIVERISIACKELNIDYRLEINSEEKSTEDILKKYKDSGDIIFAIGGDGMINRTLNGIVGTNNILGYIPEGTGNDFDKTVKETLINGINKVDLVKINNKYFINIACFGVDADIANDDYFIHNRYIPRSQRYNVSVLYHFLKYNGRNMEILIGEDAYNADYSTVVVCNGRYYGGGYKIGPNSVLDDGLLEVYLVEKLNKIKMAKLILNTKDGSHEKSLNVKKIQTTNLTIKSNNNISCNIDGEVLTSNRFDIKLIPNSIQVYYNEELIGKIKRR